jgi:hypothetical protein
MNAHGGTYERRQGSRGIPGGEPSRSQLVTTIVGNYREMPGLSLRLNQAARLFGLPPRACQAVMDHLVEQGQLRRASDGQYIAA